MTKIIIILILLWFGFSRDIYSQSLTMKISLKDSCLSKTNQFSCFDIIFTNILDSKLFIDIKALKFKVLKDNALITFEETNSISYFTLQNSGKITDFIKIDKNCNLTLTLHTNLFSNISNNLDADYQIFEEYTNSRFRIFRNVFIGQLISNKVNVKLCTIDNLNL